MDKIEDFGVHCKQVRWCSGGFGRALRCFDTGEEVGGIRAVVLERCLAPCDQSQTTNTAQNRIKPMHHPPAVLLVGHLLLQFYSLVMRGFQSYHTYNPFPPSVRLQYYSLEISFFNSLVKVQLNHIVNQMSSFLFAVSAVLLARHLLLQVLAGRPPAGPAVEQVLGAPGSAPITLYSAWLGWCAARPAGAQLSSARRGHGLQQGALPLWVFAHSEFSDYAPLLLRCRRCRQTRCWARAIWWRASWQT